MPERPQIGAQIRRARQLLDMRQQDLADKLGVSRNSVDSWENDRSYPQRKLARLEQVLGISLTAEPEPVQEDEWERWERETLSNPRIPPDLARAIVSDARAARDEQHRETGEPPPAQSGRGRHRAAG